MVSNNISRTKRVSINLVAGIINKALMIIMPFVIRTIIIKQIGANFVGLNSLYTSILNVLSLAELGAGSAMAFLLYKPISNNDTQRIGELVFLYRFVYIIIGVVVLLLGLGVSPFLKYLVDFDAFNDTNVNLYLLFFIYLLNTVVSYLFFAHRKIIIEAYQRRDVISICSFFSYSLLYASQIVSLLIVKNYYLFTLLIPIFTIFDNLLAAFISKKMFPFIKEIRNNPKQDLHTIFRNIKHLLGHKIGAVVITSSDSIVVSSVLGISLLTKYSNYHFIVMALIGILSIGYNAILASVGNAIATGNKEKTYNLYCKLRFLLFAVVCVFSSCVLVLSQDFIILWVGDGYLLDFLFVVLLVFYFYAWQIRIIGLNFKDAAGMWGQDALKPYLGMIINIVFNIIFAITIGVKGVLISTIIVMVFIYYPWETIVLYKHLFFKKYYIDFIYYIINMLTCAFVCYISFLICSFIMVNNYFDFIIKGLVAFLVSAFVLLLLSVFRKDARLLMRIKQNEL